MGQIFSLAKAFTDMEPAEIEKLLDASLEGSRGAHGTHAGYGPHASDRI